MENTKQKDDMLAKIVALAKRRGIFFQNSEIYGGIGGFFDFGPVGVEMKNNLKKYWWHFMVETREDVVGIDGTIITHPRVWEASGHVKSFGDDLVECKKCHHRFRPDKIDFAKKCPDCGGEFTEPRRYNMLFNTEIGVVEGEKLPTYLRGEACQTIYLDFKNVVDSSRMQVPFGIAQIGKAFRNEVNPGKALYRSREFEQWDVQYFVHPDEMEKWFAYWKTERERFYKSIYRKHENLRFREQQPDELCFYAKKAFDIEYNTPWGWDENEGIHWRSDYDLTQHSKFSGQDLSYRDPQTGEKFIPWIVETSGGVDRTFLFLLFDSYEEETMPNGEMRTVLKINPKIAAYKAAIFPLVGNKPEITEKARGIFKDLVEDVRVVWDDRGNIGKRYRYQDEIGTPFCVTVDYQTLEDNTVTVRDRDTMQQERIKIDELKEYIKAKIK